MRIAVISDIHANLEALKTVYEKIKDCDEIVCTGDLVGYGAEPEEVVRFIIDKKIKCVAGNHDKAATGALSTEDFNEWAAEAIEKTKKLLSTKSINFLKKLPTHIKIKDLWFVHGCPPDSYEKYIFRMDEEELKRIMEELPARIAFVGHSHAPELYIIGADVIVKELQQTRRQLRDDIKYIVNAGSVGQPRDRNNNAKCVIYNTEKNILETLYVKYDIKKTTDKIKERGFPKFNAKRLW